MVFYDDNFEEVKVELEEAKGRLLSLLSNLITILNLANTNKKEDEKYKDQNLLMQLKFEQDVGEVISSIKNKHIYEMGIDVTISILLKEKGELIADPKVAIKKFYQEGKTDEFIDPTIICADTRPISQVRDNDSIIFFNFRPDRARQLTRAFVLPTFPNFNRGGKIENLFFVTIVRYDIPLPVKIAFKVGEIKNPLAKVISDHGLKQLHTAETEKYAHVTSFFDGGRDEPFPGEDFELIPSPRVEEYDQKPEMSAYELTQFLISALDAKKYDSILVNYANPDMVGHTGNLKATIKAVEVVDECLGKVIEKINKLNGASVITADHGNAEEMINPSTGEMNKEHSTNPVPFVVVSDISKSQNSNEQIYKVKKTPIPTGLLSDIAPTVLKLMDIPKPKEMTGENLI